MTFYEAALEVLRRAERPLHYKKITEMAIRDELLSHRGKTPEVTMNDRLLKELRREEDSKLERTRPGVYKIRDDIMAELQEAARVRAEAEAQRIAEQGPEEEEEEAPEEDEEDASEEDAAPEASSDDEDQGRRRRRRGRGRRGRRGREESAPEEAEEETTEEEEEAPRERRSRGRSRRGRGRGRGRNREEEEEAPKPSNGERSSSERSSSGRGERSSGRGRGRRSDARGRNKRAADAPQRRNVAAAFAEELGPIAQAAYKVLREAGQPLALDALANTLSEQDVVTTDAALAVRAALANANQERRSSGQRLLFQSLANNTWGLTDWGMSDAALKREAEVLELAKACRADAAAFMDDVLTNLPAESLEHVFMTLLSDLGYYDIQVSKRSSDGDVYFSADISLGLSHKRVCIQLSPNEDTTLGAADIAQLRGTLHRYSATEAIIIHMGAFDDEALSEASASGAAPVALIDRENVLGLMLENNIGVRRVHTPIYIVDTTYFHQLRGE